MKRNLRSSIGVICSALLLLTQFNLTAQQNDHCGSAQQMQRDTALSSQMKARAQQIEMQTQHWNTQNSASRQGGNENVLNAPVVTIPVVVHVLYHTAAENISDAQAQSQIDALNRDYRRLNADAGNVPPVFAGVAADCEVEFCLAKRDHSGNITNGITHTFTSITSFSYNANPAAANYYLKARHSNTNGVDSWNTTQYLNIWVCSLSDIHGVSTFPYAAGTAEDGVQVRNTSFGTFGQYLEPSWMEGGITTHEVGHYLNLNHIFNDNPGASTCYSFLFQDDGLTDTPQQLHASVGCPTGLTQNWCIETPVDLPDMTMNFMDYSDDPCIYMFTLQQKARILSIFGPGGARESLKTSPGCLPPPCGFDGNEPNETQATAKFIPAISFTNDPSQPIQAKSANYHSLICRDGLPPAGAGSGDLDWFTFSNQAIYPDVKVKIYNLPLDYDLKLYNSAGVQIGSSTHGGTTADSIVFHPCFGAVSNYYIQVYGYANNFSPTQNYSLKVTLSAVSYGCFTPFRMDSTAVDQNTSDNLLIYPNPASNSITLENKFDRDDHIRLKLRDVNGKVVLDGDKEEAVSAGTFVKEINIETLAPGIYFLFIETDEGQFVRKIVKQ
ncbi:MAG: zinc-dependent metalloprotease [Bacteroidia bacterium]